MNSVLNKLTISILLLFANVGVSFSQELEWVQASNAFTAGTEAIVEIANNGDIISTGGIRDSIVFTSSYGDTSYKAIGILDSYITSTDSNGNFKWVRFIGGTEHITIMDLAIDYLGNIYCFTEFTDSIDGDLTGGRNMHYSVGDRDFILIKLNKEGKYIWSKSWGGIGFDFPGGITVDKSLNVLLCGSFEFTVDFDLSSSIDTIRSEGSSDIFILKLDSGSNLINYWRVGGVGRDHASDIEIDKNENLILTGIFSGTVDFDPSTNINTLSALWGINMYVLKLDSSANYVWAKAFGGPEINKAQRIETDNMGNILFTGTFKSYFDSDPDTTQKILSTGNYYNPFLIKLNSNGSLVWSFSLNSSYHASCSGLAIDKENFVYLSGKFTREIDFNPGIGIAKNVAFQDKGTDGYLVKLDPSGNYLWHNTLGVGGGDDITDIEIDSLGNIFTVGYYTARVDFDFGSDIYNMTSVSGADPFLARYSQKMCSSFGIKLITEKQAFCNDTGFVKGIALRGKGPIRYSWNSMPNILDSIQLFPKPGINSLTITDSIGCKSNVNYLIEGPTYQNGVDFVVDLTPGRFRRGFTSVLKLVYYNGGCDTSDGLIIFEIDSLLTVDSTNITYDSIVDNLIYWNVSNLSYDSGIKNIDIYYRTKLDASIGDSITVKVNAYTVVSDSNLLNNEVSYRMPVINSFDPNDLLSSPKGQCGNNLILQDQIISYKIRFQNTGNASAINVKIRDTISSHLDPSTINIISSSHENYTVTLNESEVIEFDFNDINLVDSGTNQEGSKGYITYQISMLDNTPDNSKLKNTAYIYFDYNDPISTNTIHHTKVSAIPIDTVYMQISACDSFTWLNDSTYYISTQSPEVTYSNKYGCDSIIKLSLTINQSTSNLIDTTSCDFLVYKSKSYFTDTTIFDTLATRNGCDSVIQLNISIQKEQSSTLDTFSCGFIVYLDSFYYSDTIVTDTFESKFGCDSIVSMEINIGITSYDTSIVKTCFGFTWINGKQYEQSSFGDTVILQNVLGCDSILVLDLEIVEIDTSISQNGDSLISNEQFGTYQWLNCDEGYKPIIGRNKRFIDMVNDGNYSVEISKDICIDTSECIELATMSITDLETSLFTVVPNPTKTQITIRFFAKNPETEVEIINSQGKVLDSQSIIGSFVTIPIMEYPPGIYFIRTRYGLKKIIISGR
ncbi:MAG: T9SS type A sorting domain-containing protein [Bacteroidia bacterium]